ncbi:putative permease YjgP/YjgQ [Candidatus Omnitrophus magneticus]|uniref:Putative permease YjgP/YjgQ n=1 Tax=Candidatus Omnitrophus magneticus TaxID=1609969 RepID=A0A0F0CP51_9BACT|nr:putative permease YjgP/YjgQ [Candidatus Omnitrophus magneticus]
MKILERYMCKSYAVTFLCCILLLMVLGIIGDILGFLDDIFNKGIPLNTILLFYLYFTPFAFVNMVPFAALLSAIFVFNNMSKHHEISAIITSGISLWNVMKPVLMVTIMFCLGTFLVNEYFVPVSTERAAYIRQYKLEAGDIGKKHIVPNLSVYGKGNIIIYAKEYYPDEKKMVDIIIQKLSEDKHVLSKINAGSALWDKASENWIGKNVIISDPNKTGKEALDSEYYDAKVLPILEHPSSFLNTQWDPRLMGYKQVRDYIKLMNYDNPAIERRLMVEFNYKFAFPFTALIVVFTGIPLSIATGRTNALIGMAKGMSVVMLYLPISAFFLALGKKGVIEPFISAHLANVIFISWGIWLVNKRS